MKQMQAEHETSAPRLMTRGRAALFALCCAGFALYGVYCNGFGTNAEAAMAYFGIDEVQNGAILTVQSAGCLAAAVFLGLFGERLNKVYALARPDIQSLWPCPSRRGCCSSARQACSRG